MEARHLAAVLIAAAILLGRSTAWCEPPVKEVRTTLIYQIDAPAPPGDAKNLADRTVEVLNRRINPGWWPRARIRRLEDNRIEISYAGDDAKKTQNLRELAEQSGSLEFRILANQSDHKAIIERALKDAKSSVVKDSDGKRMAWWVTADPKDKALVADTQRIAARKTAGGDTEVLVVSDSHNVTGAYLKAVVSSRDHTGRPCISFTLSTAGGQSFGRLTGDNLPQEDHKRQLGIILNGRLRSAPYIHSAVFDRAEITGIFTRDEVEDLVHVLNSGAMPAKLKLVEKTP